MKGIHKYLTVISLAAAVAAGCSNERTAIDPSGKVAFRVRMASMSGTKALYEESDLSSLEWFDVTGYKGAALNIDNEKVYRPQSGDIWQFDGNPKIWMPGQTMTFWASANLPAWATVTVNGESSLTLTVSAIPADAASQADPLVGYYKGTGNNGLAPLTFYHPMTALDFKAGELGEIIRINSITLKGVHQSGVAAISGGSPAPAVVWTPSGTKTDVSGAFQGDGSEGKCVQTFILIPQSLTDSPVDLVINVTAASGDKDIPAALTAGVLEAGHIYSYTLNYTSLGITSDGQELGPQFNLSRDIDSITGKTFSHEWDRNDD